MLHALVGLRSLNRNRRRSILTGLMLTFGTTMVMFNIGLGEGSYAMMIDTSTRTMLGHAQVLDPQYHDKPSLYKTVNNPQPLLEALRAHPPVQDATARVESAGLVSRDKFTTGVVITGVDPSHDPQTLLLSKAVKEGSWFKETQSEEENLPIILGRGVLKRLRAKLGDEVSFVSQAADGSMAAELYDVVGVYESGAEIDNSFAMIRLRDAQELFALGERVHRIIVTHKEGSSLKELMALKLKLDGPIFASWKALNPTLVETIDKDRKSNRSILAIMILVAILGVTNTMLMSVFERTREFGVMLALGTRPRTLISFVFFEILWLSLFGIGLGVALGTFCVTQFPISMGEQPMEFAGIVFTEIQGIMVPDAYIGVPLLILVATLIAGIFPARRISKLQPTEAFRR